ncbi:hypothetical protein [Legionella maceachernii]|uniref:Cyclodipeptide synthase n=1 Tax=Legionella maceachernii TaxID=466 RepID=A0A0W0VUU9_9GAMM|nr:hypothetical protein [Legionella maceachernii]KTD23916.1 hypothetical protein Lmac_2789 [Legionella maceachernii]SKA17862.1 Cyclodipeptide synthase [Legionella maceachernii]SUP04545.1 Uncharacterised protein [Legionella maceachernii]
MHHNLTKKAILKSKHNLTHGSKTIITISVGQPNHEGDKLLSTLIAANKQFSFIRIMVCDSLQRHTMKITSPLSIEELHDISVQLGSEWIERNNMYIKALTVPYHISRWDEWLYHPDFNYKQRVISDLYLNDSSFKSSILDTVNEFITRNPERLLVDSQTAFNLSRDYLLEECAVMLLLADEEFEYEIYPSQRNKALDYVYQAVISKVNSKLMQAVSIKFKNISYNEIKHELA